MPKRTRRYNDENWQPEATTRTQARSVLDLLQGSIAPTSSMETDHEGTVGDVSTLAATLVASDMARDVEKVDTSAVNSLVASHDDSLVATDAATDATKDAAFDPKVLNQDDSLQENEMRNAPFATTLVSTLVARDVVAQTASDVATVTETPAITPAARLATDSPTTPLPTLAASDVSIREMARWHTDSEQKVYAAMIDEVRREQVEEWYFTFRRLTALTNLKNPRTLQTAIDGLIEKRSIERLTNDPGDHLGRLYRIYEPVEVVENRKQGNIKIHPQTKRII